MRSKISAFSKMLIAAIVTGLALVQPAIADPGASADSTGSPAATQENIQSLPAATIDELGQLDSQIEVLKKKLEIKKLENEIEAESKEEEEEHENPGKKKSPFDFSQRLRQMPFSTQSAVKNQAPVAKPPVKPEPPTAAMEKQRQAEEARQNIAQEQEFEQYISMARVISVNGFGKNIKAEIKLPGGGALSVKEGQDCRRLGKIASVSHNNVVLKKYEKDFYIPFSEEFKNFQSAIKQPSAGDFLTGPEPNMDSASIPDPGPPPFVPE